MPRPFIVNTTQQSCQRLKLGSIQDACSWQLEGGIPGSLPLCFWVGHKDKLNGLGKQVTRCSGNNYPGMRSLWYHLFCGDVLSLCRFSCGSRFPRSVFCNSLCGTRLFPYTPCQTRESMRISSLTSTVSSFQCFTRHSSILESTPDCLEKMTDYGMIASQLNVLTKPISKAKWSEISTFSLLKVQVGVSLNHAKKYYEGSCHPQAVMIDAVHLARIPYLCNFPHVGSEIPLISILNILKPLWRCCYHTSFNHLPKPWMLRQPCSRFAKSTMWRHPRSWRRMRFGDWPWWWEGTTLVQEILPASTLIKCI